MTEILGVRRFMLDWYLRFVCLFAQKKVIEVAARSATMLKVTFRMPPIVNTTIALGMGAVVDDDVVVMFCIYL